MTVLNLFHFQEFSDLILLKTSNASLETSSDFKHSPASCDSHCFQHMTGVTHGVSFQDIQKNRNLPETYDVCWQTPSNSKAGFVL